jgi:hypothetical protein
MAVEIQILVRKGTVKNTKLEREMCLETRESTDWNKERAVNVTVKTVTSRMNGTYSRGDQSRSAQKPNAERATRAGALAVSVIECVSVYE